MELTDFLTAQLARARHVVWLGPLDDRLDRTLVDPIVELRELTSHEEPSGQGAATQDLAVAADDASTVLVLSGDGTIDHVLSPERLAMLSVRPVGTRSAVVADDGQCDLHVLAETLADAGQQVVHAVRLHGSPGGSRALGVSIEHVSTDTGDRTPVAALAEANIKRLLGSPLAEPAAPGAEDPALEARQALARERGLRREADARALRLQADLDAARDDLVRLRRSAAMQMGRAVGAALDDPRRGVPALPGRVRTVLSDRKARRVAASFRTASTGTVSADARSTTPGAGRPSLPRGGRRRQFDLSLPDASTVADSPYRRSGGPSSMRIDVPYSFFIPLRLERDGLAGYEPETLAWWLALCDTAGDGVVWDVGANTGLFAALAAAATTREVVAFEPTPDLSAWARTLAVDNGLDYSVEQVAASDVDGNATFFLSDSTDSSSSLSEGFRESTHQLDVVTERLDTYQRRTGHVPALVKVDTETTEPAVLRGASSVVLEHRPWILCEVLANCGVEEPLMELAGEWGYRWYHLTEELPPPSPDRIIGDETFTYFMYLLAPEEIDDQLVERVRAWRSALARCTPR